MQFCGDRPGDFVTERHNCAALLDAAALPCSGELRLSVDAAPLRRRGTSSRSPATPRHLLSGKNGAPTTPPPAPLACLHFAGRAISSPATPALRRPSARAISSPASPSPIRANSGSPLHHVPSPAKKPPARCSAQVFFLLIFFR